MQSLPCIPLPAAAADAKRTDKSVTVEEIRSMRSFLHADTTQVKIPMDASFDVNGDGCVDVFDMALLKRSFTAQQETTGDFYRLSSELVQENDVRSGAIIMADDFYSKRVIVKTEKEMDFKKYSPASVISGPDHIYVLQFDSVEKAEVCMTALRGSEDIVYVELDTYMKSDEPQGAVTAAEANSWGVEEIEADQYAAYLSQYSDASAVVAVVDTGVSKHEFLGDRLLSTGYDLVDNDADPSDLHYHGTHVAGTVVDCTPGLDVKIMGVRVLDKNGSGSNLNVGNGIRYAVDHGANVINLSLSGKGCSCFIDDAINYAVRHGVTVVAAAGNHASNTVHYCPAHIDNCIVVGACDGNLRAATFTNTGNSVDVIAPGVNIKSCIPGGSYKNLNGTSMATPHIAAAAAMIKMADPQATPAEVESRLKEICQDLGDAGKDPVFGCGIPKLSELIEDDSVERTITLSEAPATMFLGDQLTLEATTTPKVQRVQWESSDTTVATVKDGVVTAVGEGGVRITASITHGDKTVKAYCMLGVLDNSETIIESGQCGDNVYYTLDGNGLLKVFGKGSTWRYSSSAEAALPDKAGIDISPVSPLGANEQITKVKVEEGITLLDHGLFSDCTSMKDIELPSTIAWIEPGVFADCSSLESIDIPENIIMIGGVDDRFDMVFYGCSSLKRITIGEGNRSYISDDGAILSKDGKKLIYIPEGKTDYVIKEGITTLCEGCSRTNASLTELIVPQSVERIEAHAFAGCKNLKHLELGSGVKYIGDEAFYNTKITTLTIPNSVTYIGSNAFAYCLIDSVTFAPYGVDDLTISRDAFNYIKTLKSLTLPERTKKITFSKRLSPCDIESVTILSKEIEIDSDAFDKEKTTLHGYAKSDVQTYAEEQGVPFVALKEN